ncbi:MAG: 50S ribosomal protein L6 [Muribaculaceae bacterium]|nr:50S ribosomal protein L6 [Muribaculaceae bacterium]
MSRIGKLPIAIPAGVTIDIKDNVINVKGPKGELKQALNPNITVQVEDGQITVSRPDDNRESRAQHGLYRALINNMVVGVSTGFKKELEIVGVGYRATMKNPQTIELALGYSHVIYIKMPPEVKADAKSERNKNPLITLESCDKQLLGQICAKIRSFRKPEPYKGKGVKFVGEVIRRKSGKTAAAK